MVTILHGDHHVQSRARLAELLAAATAAGRQLVRVEAKNQTLSSLEQTLGSQELFAPDRLVLIEELHSLPLGQRRKELIVAVASHGQIDHPQTDYILWEKKKLTATQLKPFVGATVTEFKLSSSLFKWLDSLDGTADRKPHQLQLLTQLLVEEDAAFALAMMIRQIRLLLQLKTGGAPKLPPFMLGKLRQQAGSFTQAQLFQIHNQLLTLDHQFKTSRNTLKLDQAIGLMIWNW